MQSSTSAADSQAATRAAAWRFPTATSADAPTDDPTVMQLSGLTRGWLNTQLVHAFAVLNIADALSTGPQSAAQVAATVGCDEDATNRLLRAGVFIQLVKASDSGQFSATPLLQHLETARQSPLRSAALINGAHCLWRPWGNLVEAVRTGRGQSESTLGSSFYGFLEHDKAESEHFTESMRNTSELAVAAVIAVLDLADVSTVADVGCASGSFLYAVLNSHPHLQGLLLDRASVLPHAETEAKRRGLSDRTKALPCDFMQSVPAADMYLLKRILHDFTDADCVTILTNCRNALRANGRVVIVEFELGPDSEPGGVAVSDLGMLILFGARERTVAQYEALMKAAGLQLARVQTVESARGPWLVLEARAAAGTGSQ